MNAILKSILDFIYGLVQNYGLSIVVFTIVIRLCLLPLDYKSRKGMRKMTSLMPKQQEIQKKYGHDQDKMNRKLQELYKKEGASPMAGCWPMLLSMPIMFAMFYAMRAMANEQMARQAFEILLNGEPVLEPFLWLKNLWAPDNPFFSAWPTATNLATIEADQWKTMFALLSPEQVDILRALPDTLTEEVVAKVAVLLDLSAEEVVAKIAVLRDLSADSFAKGSLKATADAIGVAMTATPGYTAATTSIDWLTVPLVGWSVKASWNGLLILPIASSLSQYVSTKISSAQQQQTTVAGNDEKAQQQQSTNKFMTWFFPLFSLWICLTTTASFALYWVVSNLVHMAMNQFINWHLDRKDKQAAEAAA